MAICLFACVQDLEEEAIKLRISKKPVTSKAQMLLQSASVSLFCGCTRVCVCVCTCVYVCCDNVTLLSVLSTADDSVHA